MLRTFIAWVLQFMRGSASSSLALLLLLVLIPFPQLAVAFAWQLLGNLCLLLGLASFTPLARRIGTRHPYLVAQNVRISGLLLLVGWLLFMLPASWLWMTIASAKQGLLWALCWTWGTGSRFLGRALEDHLSDAGWKKDVSVACLLDLATALLAVPVFYALLGPAGIMLGIGGGAFLRGLVLAAFFRKRNAVRFRTLAGLTRPDLRLLRDAAYDGLGKRSASRVYYRDEASGLPTFRYAERQIVITPGRVVKKQPPAVARDELAKTRQGILVSERMGGLFRVPRVLAADLATGIIEFERLYDVAPLREHLTSHDESTRLLTVAAKTLAAIHAHMTLPAGMQVALPMPWGVFTRQTCVCVHGDYTVSNLMVDRQTGDLIVTDWATSDHRCHGRGTIGPPHFDVVWFLLSLLASNPSDRDATRIVLQGQHFTECYFRAAPGDRSRAVQDCIDYWSLVAESLTQYPDVRHRGQVLAILHSIRCKADEPRSRSTQSPPLLDRQHKAA